MRKMSSLISGFIFMFSFVAITPSLAEFIQINAPPEISISDFVLVDSNQYGNILSRTFKLKVENNTKAPLYNVKFTLIHSSDQANIEKGEIYLGNINPGQVVTSIDVFTYSINTSKVAIIPHVDLHWGIQFEISNQQILGEAMIVEKIQ